MVTEELVQQIAFLVPPKLMQVVGVAVEDLAMVALTVVVEQGVVVRAARPQPQEQQTQEVVVGVEGMARTLAEMTVTEPQVVLASL